MTDDEVKAAIAAMTDDEKQAFIVKAGQYLRDNPPTPEQIEAFQDKVRRGIYRDPLVVLLEISEDATNPLALRRRAAMAAAPYLQRH
jgi:hypothetical protein